jgi:hypothetical protein
VEVFYQNLIELAKTLSQRNQKNEEADLTSFAIESLLLVGFLGIFEFYLSVFLNF